jgi:hypothetical protein
MIQRFGKHFSCHLQGESDLPSPLFLNDVLFSHWIAATTCLLCIRLRKTPNHYALTMKMAISMFAETLNNSQHSTLLNPESRRYTLHTINA